MNHSKSLNIFISYAWGGTLDKKEWIRDQIVSIINREFNVFWDRDTIEFGMSIDKCIGNALKVRPLKVFCICDVDYIHQAAVLGSGLQRELLCLEKIAQDEDVRIIPLIFSANSSHLPPPLLGRAYLDLSELSRRSLYVGDLMYALANGISQADMYKLINKKISSNDLRNLAKIHFQKLDMELYGNARTHEVTITPLQPLLPPKWMWESDEWGYMLSDETDTFCPAKGRWHWDYFTPSRGMRALGTVAMSVFFPGQTSASDQAAFHRAGNVLAKLFFQ